MTDEVVSSPAPEAAPVVSTQPVSGTAEASIVAPVETVLGAPDAPVEAATEVESGTEAAPEIKEVAPEVKPEPTPEVKTEAETKPEVKPEVKPETKPADASADKTQPEGEKKEESSQSDEPASLPSYEPWKFPDNVKIDEAQIGEVNKMFGEFELEAKVDPHAAMQKYGQQFLDRHIAGVQAAINTLAEAYQQSWKDQTKNWYESFVKDPEIGGEKKDASAAAAREFIRRHGGTAEQQNELRKVMQDTGIGNHPAFIRAFAKATVDLSEGKLVTATKPPAPPQSRKQKFYGSKS